MKVRMWKQALQVQGFHFSRSNTEYMNISLAEVSILPF